MSTTDPTPDRPLVRWGVLGPGRIAEKVVDDLRLVDGAVLTAVGSRSFERAREFADQHDVPNAHGSYRELVDDPEVDVVYIATPHPQHRDPAIAALDAGKGVLVEKAFAATEAGARAIADAARANGRFAMEAMWTRFQPTVVEVRRLVEEGAIGEVRSVQAELGVDRPYDPTDRLFDLAQGGGAMLDLGVYVVSLADWFLRDGTDAHPDVCATGSLAPTGVDLEAGILLGYPTGRVASLLVSLRNHLPGAARIYGTEGWIEIEPRFHHPTRATVHRRGHDVEVVDLSPDGAGYSHELAEVTECVRRGETESRVMPLRDSIAIQRILDEASARLGVEQHDADVAI